MPLLPQTPAFIPPVVAVPAANAIVPFVAPAAAAVAGSAGLAAGAPLAAAAAVGLGVGLLAGLAGAQLWGGANQPREAPPGAPPEGALDVSTITGQGTGSGRLRVEWIPDGPDQTPRYYDAGPDNGTVTKFRRFKINDQLFYWEGFTYEWEWTENGAKQHGCINRLVFGGCNGFDNPPSRGPLGTVSWQRVPSPDAEPIPLVPTPYVPPPLPEVLPGPEPLAEPLVVPPLPLAPPFAPPAPARPAPVPEPAAVPNPGRPAVVPQAPPATLPYAPALPQPAGVPISTAGTVTPQLPPGPTTTPTGTHFPGGVPIPSNPPQATPEGIAEELGRIEKKLAKLLSPQGTPIGNLLDQIDEYARLAARVWEALSSLTAGGSYPLSSPCVLDENDERVVLEVEYGGALGAFGVLSNKIDALAELLQVHKDLKQPICRQTPAVGQPVQVQFVQIE